jgi:hypothetical protein
VDAGIDHAAVYDRVLGVAVMRFSKRAPALAPNSATLALSDDWSNPVTRTLF